VAFCTRMPMMPTGQPAGLASAPRRRHAALRL
jgi:hypothetical protein